MKIRTYEELKRIPTFYERFEYLKLSSVVGESTFGFDRYLNQKFYRSREWMQARNQIILRDQACDLGIYGYEITNYILIHHMNPITVEDIKLGIEAVINPDFLICTTQATHRAIHYGDKSLLTRAPVARRPNDTIPWRQLKE